MEPDRRVGILGAVGSARLEVPTVLGRGRDRREGGRADVVRSMAAGATITEAEGAQVIIVSQPETVATVITTAAAAVAHPAAAAC